MAFGLRLSGEFPAPGLWSGVGSPAMPRVSLEVVEPAVLARSWSALEAERRLRLPVGPEGPVLAIDHHPRLGHLVRAGGFGAYLIATDGRRVQLAPGRVEAWRWQRLLTAQVLPIAALAQGLELLHASAVALNGRVLAFAGATGAGKSTLAARLLLGGAGFVADDVLALQRVQDDVIAHPGPALMNLRGSSSHSFDPRELARLGVELGRDEAAARLRVRRRAGASPLHAIYLLNRSASRGGGVEVKRLGPPVTSELLGTAFGTAITTRARLIRHLDLCAHLARRVPIFSLEVPAGAAPDAVAGTVVQHTGRAP
jgi:hypothetical protein